jgi:hypothetical protein
MQAYNTGQMPGTDLRYEDFEGFLASYALTLRCLEKSGRTSDPEDYAEVVKILDGFAQRYRVQPPLATLRTPRSHKGSAKPQEFTNQEMIQMINSFWQDFCVGRVYPGKQFGLDAVERIRLGRIILNIFDRYALADVEYVNEKGDRVPVKVKKWLARENRNKTIADSIREWRSWQV